MLEFIAAAKAVTVSDKFDFNSIFVFAGHALVPVDLQLSGSEPATAYSKVTPVWSPLVILNLSPDTAVFVAVICNLSILFILASSLLYQGSGSS